MKKPKIKTIIALMMIKDGKFAEFSKIKTNFTKKEIIKMFKDVRKVEIKVID